MPGFKLCITTYGDSEDQVVKEVLVNFRPQPDGKHKPLVAVKNTASGMELKFDLPPGDYSNLDRLLEKISSAGLNPDKVEKAFSKVMLLLKFLK